MTLELFCVKMLTQWSGNSLGYRPLNTTDDLNVAYHNPLSKPFQACTPACGSPTKACTPGCREEWEDPPFSIWWSYHWAMACPMGPTRDWMERQKASKGFSSLANTRGMGQELWDHVFLLAISWVSVIGIQDMPDAGRGSQGQTPLSLGA